jgi:hypothetical protein
MTAPILKELTDEEASSEMTFAEPQQLHAQAIPSGGAEKRADPEKGQPELEDAQAISSPAVTYPDGGARAWGVVIGVR